MKNQANVDALLAKIQSSKKYQDLGVPEETLRDLLEQELARHSKPAEALKSARAKLHNIMAPYLGDPDYAQAADDLRHAFAQDPEAVDDTCRELLRQHDSTRERLAYLDDFYAGIRSVCGQPHSVLDLACGLNPLALPWMGLPADCNYYAYDIHPARVALLNEFLRLSGHEPLAEVRDVLVRPPEVQADAAFLFKEAHRMEKRQKGCNRGLWAALKVRYLFVSLPNRSLDGRRDLRERMRTLVDNNLNPQDWVERGELDFPGETIYWMRKNG
ncbi:MAG: rRNA ((1405)-N(7))-methyltransferase [Chloroflexota bacterium]|nr:rRNA ((1405)-N(7))-methyltransferase [Chloroflexota bacterium]